MLQISIIHCSVIKMNIVKLQNVCTANNNVKIDVIITYIKSLFIFLVFLINN